MLKELDVAMLLGYNAVIYTVCKSCAPGCQIAVDSCLDYCVTGSTSVLLTEIYGLNQLQVGLCFLPIGVAALVGAITQGPILDHDFKLIKTRMLKSRKLTEGDEAGSDCTVVEATDPNDLTNFPIEHARLLSAAWLLPLYIISLVAYGWCLKARTTLALPLIFQFLIGFSSFSLQTTAS